MAYVEVGEGDPADQATAYMEAIVKPVSWDERPKAVSD